MRVSARVRVKVDNLGGHQDRGLFGGLKTGEKKGWPHTGVKFTHCTKYLVQGRSEGGNSLTKLH